MVLHFYNTCLNSLNISALFSGGLIIFSTFIEFSSITGFVLTILSSFDLATASAIFFLQKFTCFMDYFFGTSFKRISVLYPIIVFLYFFDKFLPNDKNIYPLTYFLVLGSIK